MPEKWSGIYFHPAWVMRPLTRHGDIGRVRSRAGWVSYGPLGEVVAVAAVVGIAGIVVILVLQRWLPKVPAVLVMVVLAIAATSVFSLADHGVSLVGVLPGVPSADRPGRPLV